MLDDRWHELSVDECQALLGASHLGRVGLVDDGRPLILPVNYVLDEATVVFRTDPGSKLAAALRGAAVAFEVDGVNAQQRTGWSVLVQGRAEHVTDPAELERLAAYRLVPWAPGARPHYVRVRSEKTTGRRISVADLPQIWWG
jgi:nitroimidazol reductase NimA-like FMN-containing flavoprotein (pyridoxamine 5'-phosphate oxidase superfamily)